MFEQTLERYEGYLQLHDHRTMWKLENPTLPDYEADRIYNNLVEQACDMFKERTGQVLLLLGRMDRHVCVEDTKENSRRYQWLKKIAIELEDWVITAFNEAVPE